MRARSRRWAYGSSPSPVDRRARGPARRSGAGGHPTRRGWTKRHVIGAVAKSDVRGNDLHTASESTTLEATSPHFCGKELASAADSPHQRPGARDSATAPIACFSVHPPAAAPPADDSLASPASPAPRATRAARPDTPIWSSGPAQPGRRPTRRHPLRRRERERRDDGFFPASLESYATASIYGATCTPIMETQPSGGTERRESREFGGGSWGSGGCHSMTVGRQRRAAFTLWIMRGSLGPG
jgi:hypothetical protein